MDDFYTRRYMETALRGIAAEHPDTVNPRGAYDIAGVYDDGNGNHCIIGHFLHNEGLPMPQTNGTAGNELRLSGVWDVGARVVADVVQVEADRRRHTWGQAVVEAGIA